MRRTLVALLLTLQCGAASAAQAGAPPAPDAGTITITAPREKPAPGLKTARTGGAAVAAGGLGAMGYIVLAAPTGPLGWAAAAVFLGGMSAYLAHRRLHGHDDFAPATAARPVSSARAGLAPYDGK